MSYANWLNTIQNAKKTSIIRGNIRKIHYTFPDNHEMVEEYSMETGVVLKRAWKLKKRFNIESDWEIELGDIVRPINDSHFVVRESTTEPILSKRVTRINIEWRIRNLPYSLNTYLVVTDRDKKSIIIRTTNKKYYKEIRIPELDRCEILPEQDSISVKHQYNTLIVTYKKPLIVLDMEKAVLLMLKDVETETDLDIDCNDLLKQLIE